MPDTDITLNPDADGKQTVNLPTWAWLDKSTFKPVSVTASVPEIDLSATTTATPKALKIEPGTSDAELFPASGECAINKDGSIGTPYTKGTSDKTPPCGLTYHHSTSGSGPYQFKATITWEIAWTGSDGSGATCPTGRSAPPPTSRSRRPRPSTGERMADRRRTPGPAVVAGPGVFSGRARCGQPSRLGSVQPSRSRSILLPVPTHAGMMYVSWA
ncbi:hypothetical protein NKH77_33445 [Streptomyces sp. M19]